MKKIALVFMVLFLAGCAELQVVSDILDILVPDDPCSKTVEATIDKAEVKGTVIYRVSIPSGTPIYEFDSLSARSIAARMETDFHENCKNRKVRDKLEKQREIQNEVVEGKAKPQWEKVK